MIQCKIFVYKLHATPNPSQHHRIVQRMKNVTGEKMNDKEFCLFYTLDSTGLQLYIQRQLASSLFCQGASSLVIIMYLRFFISVYWICLSFYQPFIAIISILLALFKRQFCFLARNSIQPLHSFMIAIVLCFKWLLDSSHFCLFREQHAFSKVKSSHRLVIQRILSKTDTS